MTNWIRLRTTVAAVAATCALMSGVASAQTPTKTADLQASTTPGTPGGSSETCAYLMQALSHARGAAAEAYHTGNYSTYQSWLIVIFHLEAALRDRCGLLH